MSAELFSLLDQAQFSVVALSSSALAAAFSEVLFPRFDQSRNPFLQLVEGLLEMTLHYVLGIELLFLFVPFQSMDWPMTALTLFTPVMLPRAYSKMSSFVAQLSDGIRPELPVPVWSPTRRTHTGPGNGRGSGGRIPDVPILSPLYVQAWTAFRDQALGDLGQIQASLGQLSSELEDARQAAQTRKQGHREKAQARFKDLAQAWRDQMAVYKVAAGKYALQVQEWGRDVSANQEQTRTAIHKFTENNAELLQTIGALGDWLVYFSNNQEKFKKWMTSFDTKLAGFHAEWQQTAAYIEKIQKQTTELVGLAECTQRQAQNTNETIEYQWSLAQNHCEVVPASGKPTNDPDQPADPPPNDVPPYDNPTSLLLVPCNSSCQTLQASGVAKAYGLNVTIDPLTGDQLFGCRQPTGQVDSVRCKNPVCDGPDDHWDSKTQSCYEDIRVGY